MAIDGLLIHFLTDELQNKIRGARINKIIQADPYTFEFILHNYQQYNLLINLNRSNPRFYLTKDLLKAPNNPYNFCMVLRKYLEHGIINAIEQYENDRIVIFHLTSLNELGDVIEYRLIVELTGKTANLILCFADLTIIDALTKQFSLDSPRLIIPKAKYEFLASNKLNPFTNQNTTNPQGFANFHLQQLQEQDLKSFLSQPVIPTKYQIENKTFYSPFLNKGYPNYKTYPSISEMLDEETNEIKESNPEYNLLKKIIRRKITLLTNKLTNLDGDLEKAKKHQDDNHLGILLKTYLYDVKKGMKEIKVIDYETNQEIKITLDPLLSPIQNMERYFKQYKKSLMTFTKVAEQKQVTLDEIAYFNDLSLALDLAYETNSLLKSENNDALIQDVKDELIKCHLLQNKKKSMKKKPSNIKQYALDDALIFVGKNVTQNNQLIAKLGKPNDYWFHVADSPSAHVIARCGELNERIIRICAHLAALNSKYEASSSVKVDYTFFKNVKKIPNTIGCNVTYTHQKSIYIDPSLETLNTLLNEKEPK